MNRILKESNGIEVWVALDGYVYKRNKPIHLAQNEWHSLWALSNTPYVPWAEQIDDLTVKMEFIDNEDVTDTKKFMLHYKRIMKVLWNAGIRHGDLTEPNILVSDNLPVIIDWAESRMWCDRRPDKRPEGDAFWLKTTMEQLCGKSTD